jgi:hypothetical protein
MKIEINSKQLVHQDPHPNIMITPALDEDFWLMRVPVSENQAIICFPKFGTIGIGFQIEKEDWNTNLPYSCDAEEIFEHIKENKGYNSISDKNCIDAIKMLQEEIKDKFD